MIERTDSLTWLGGIAHRIGAVISAKKYILYGKPLVLKGNIIRIFCIIFFSVKMQLFVFEFKYIAYYNVTKRISEDYYHTQTNTIFLKISSLKRK